MDKSEFVKRAAKQFDFVIRRAKDNQEKTLSGRRQRMDAASFIEWMKGEREKILNEPALITYDRVLAPSMSTPYDAAQSLADLIELDLGQVNWKSVWEMAAPILTGNHAKKVNWKFDNNVTTYLEAVKAAEKAKVFTRFIVEMQIPEQVEPPMIEQFDADQIPLPLELDEEIQLTFEDWQNDRFPKTVRYVASPFERILIRGVNGELKYHTLSKEEHKKIADAQNGIFEKWVGFFTQELIKDFEQQYNNSMEKESLVKLELKQVEQYLTDRKLPSVSFPFSYPNGHWGVKVLGGLGSFLKEGEDSNPLPKWYEYIIVRGREARIYSLPGYKEGNEYLPTPFAVHVLYRYRQFLESRLTKSKTAPTAITTEIQRQEQLPVLEDAMKTPKILPVLWKRLSEMDKAFVDEKGKILGGRKARKHREIMALAQVISKLFKDGYGMFEIYSMLCVKVELDESERPGKIPNRPGYDDIRLALLSELKDLLK